MWDELPQIVLTEIFLYLSNDDRLSASLTCLRWRNTLFQKRFFKTISIDVSRENERKNAFLLRSLAHLVDSVTIAFNPQSHYGVQQTAKALQRVVTNNNCLKCLKFRPKYSTILLPKHGQKNEFVAKFFLEPIKALASRRDQLLELDFGGLEMLTKEMCNLLQLLHKPEKLECLAGASVKQDPTIYELKPFDYELFSKFTGLRKLSIDYDDFDDDFLHILSNCPKLDLLVIAVHSLDVDEHPGTSETAWSELVAKNSKLLVHLNLIYATEAVHLLHSHIFCRFIPLAQLKVLFCNYINYEALEFLSNFNKTLTSVIWVDLSSDDPSSMINTTELYFGNEPDPLVMMAWTCKKLEELVVHGYFIESNNLIGIARLRGSNLKRLEVSHLVWSPKLGEISELMNKPWTSLPHTPLNKIFMGDGGNSKERLCDQYIMQNVQRDFDANHNQY